MNRIVIKEQENGKFIADRPKEPGTPIVGRGSTWKEALGDLLLQSTYKAVGPFEEPPLVLHKDGTPFKFREPRR